MSRTVALAPGTPSITSFGVLGQKDLFPSSPEPPFDLIWGAGGPYFVRFCAVVLHCGSALCFLAPRNTLFPTDWLPSKTFQTTTTIMCYQKTAIRPFILQITPESAHLVRHCFDQSVSFLTFKQKPGPCKGYKFRVSKYPLSEQQDLRATNIPKPQ